MPCVTQEYGDRKSTAITCATRLGQFLGADNTKDKGLSCNYIIAKKPEGMPTSQRAIPLTIFSTEPAVARSFIRQWTKDTPPGEQVRKTIIVAIIISVYN